MLLTVDIGNTHITLGVFRGDDLLLESRLATDPTRTEDQYAIELKDILRLYGVDQVSFKGAIISSVVPTLDRVFRLAVEKVTGVAPLTVGPGTKTGVNIRIDNPAQLGADLLVGAVAAIAKYGAPCIVWDLGTASTASVVDKDGAFRGGAILPGVITSLNSLASAASLLPQVSLEKPAHAIGTNTIDCMRSGAVYGTAAMLNGINRRFFDELGYEAPVIVTGGLGRDIVPHCDYAPIYDSDLLLHGLRIIYEKNRT